MAITFPRNILQLHAEQSQQLVRPHWLELRTLVVLLRRISSSFDITSGPHVGCSSEREQRSQTNRAHTWRGDTYRWNGTRISSKLPQRLLSRLTTTHACEHSPSKQEERGHMRTTALQKVHQRGLRSNTTHVEAATSSLRGRVRSLRPWWRAYWDD